MIILFIFLCNLFYFLFFYCMLNLFSTYYFFNIDDIFIVLISGMSFLTFCGLSDFYFVQQSLVLPLCLASKVWLTTNPTSAPQPPFLIVIVLCCQNSNTNPAPFLFFFPLLLKGDFFFFFKLTKKSILNDLLLYFWPNSMPVFLKD